MDREFKTATRYLDQLNEKANAFDEQRNKLDRDADEVQQKSDNVSRTVQQTSAPNSSFSVAGKESQRPGRGSQEYKKRVGKATLRECADPVGFTLSNIISADFISGSQLEKEINEKLDDTYQRLLQASVDRHESEKEAKLKETLANLSRIFTGMSLCSGSGPVTELPRRCAGSRC